MSNVSKPIQIVDGRAELRVRMFRLAGDVDRARAMVNSLQSANARLRRRVAELERYVEKLEGAL